MTQRAEETGKSESCAVMAQIGPLKGGDTHPERGQTSGGLSSRESLRKR
jgi:hypothetical protein